MVVGNPVTGIHPTEVQHILGPLGAVLSPVGIETNNRHLAKNVVGSAVGHVLQASVILRGCIAGDKTLALVDALLGIALEAPEGTPPTARSKSRSCRSVPGGG